METTNKVIATVGLAIVVSLLGYMIKGAFGAAMGFVLTLLVIGLFSIWNK